MRMKTETDFLIAVTEVSRIAGISRTEVWRQVRAGTFPVPTRMAPRCTRYSLREVSEWVQQRLAERGGKAA